MSYFTENLLTCEEKLINVQAVIEGKIKYENMIYFDVRRKFNKHFGVNFTESVEYQLFWENLGKSIKDLFIDTVTISSESYGDYEKYLTNLRELRINYADILGVNVTELCKRNHNLETITLITNREPLLECLKIDNERNFYSVHKILNEILLNCKSLKKIRFPSAMNVEYETLVECFFIFNDNYIKIQQENIIFEFDQLPFWIDYKSHYWQAEKIELVFERNEDDTKIKISVSDIRIRNKYVDNKSKGLYSNQNTEKCDENCEFDHQVFKSKSIKKLAIHDKSNICLKFLMSSFESFPSLESIEFEFLCDEIMLKSISKYLKNLKSCSLRFERDLSKWVKIPAVTHLNVKFETTSKDNFKKFTKAFLNIEFLRLEIKNGLSSDHCAELISENCANLKFLDMHCDGSQLSALGIKKFQNLKNLEDLHVDSLENDFEFKILFDQLNRLKSVHSTLLVSITAERFKNDARTTVAPQVIESPKLPMNISQCLSSPLIIYRDLNDLPVEILENIFSYFNYRKLSRLMQVCKLWYHIIESSDRLKYALHFDCVYLSMNTVPIKFLMHTNFKHKRIIISESVNVAENEDLSSFWNKIGQFAQEIQLDGLLTITLKSGLKASHFPLLENLIIHNLWGFGELLANDHTYQNSEEIIKIIEKIKTLKILYTLHTLINETETEGSRKKINLKNLQKLEINSSNKENLELFLKHINITSLKEMHLYRLYDVSLLNILTLEFDFKQLKSLSLVIRNRQKKIELKKQDFELFVERCSSLETFNLTVEQISVRSINLDEVAKFVFSKLFFLNKITFVVNIDDKSRNCNLQDKPVINVHRNYYRKGINGVKKEEKIFNYKWLPRIQLD